MILNAGSGEGEQSYSGIAGGTSKLIRSMRQISDHRYFPIKLWMPGPMAASPPRTFPRRQAVRRATSMWVFIMAPLTKARLVTHWGRGRCIMNIHLGEYHTSITIDGHSMENTGCISPGRLWWARPISSHDVFFMGMYESRGGCRILIPENFRDTISWKWRSLFTSRFA